MTDNSLAPDSSNIGSQIEQNTKGDRNTSIGNMSGGQVNNYYVSHDGKLQAHTESKPSPPKIPPLLPYMPDRKQQEFELAEAVKKHLDQAHLKPLICILHGYQHQCHV